jgi:hypothetical protein
MIQLGEVYQQQLSDLQLDGYWQALEDLPLAQVRSAMFHAFRTRVFFPKPAEIRSDAWLDDERERPSHPKALESGRRFPEMGTECAEYLKKIWAHEFTRAEIVAWMLGNEERWPYVGWMTEADALERAPLKRYKPIACTRNASTE